MRRGDERNALVDELNHRASIERGEGDGGLKAIGTIGIGAAIVVEHYALAGGHLHLAVGPSGDDDYVFHRTATGGIAGGYIGLPIRINNGHYSSVNHSIVGDCRLNIDCYP